MKKKNTAKLLLGMTLIFAQAYGIDDYTERDQSFRRGANYQEINYEDFLNEEGAKRIVNFDADIRSDILKRIGDYQTLRLSLVEIKSAVGQYENTVSKNQDDGRQRKVGLAEAYLQFYLNLKYKEEERVTELQTQKITLQEKALGIVNLAKSAETAAQVDYLVLEKKIRHEERSFFGWLKDTFVGRRIAEAPGDANFVQISQFVQRYQVELVSYLDEQISSLRDQNQITIQNITDARGRLLAIQNS